MLFREVHVSWKHLVDKLPRIASLPLKHEIEIIDGYSLTPRGQRATINYMYICGNLVAVLTSMLLLKQYTTQYYINSLTHTKVNKANSDNIV